MAEAQFKTNEFYDFVNKEVFDAVKKGTDPQTGQAFNGSKARFFKEIVQKTTVRRYLNSYYFNDRLDFVEVFANPLGGIIEDLYIGTPLAGDLQRYADGEITQENLINPLFIKTFYTPTSFAHKYRVTIPYDDPDGMHNNDVDWGVFLGRPMLNLELARKKMKASMKVEVLGSYLEKAIKGYGTSTPTDLFIECSDFTDVNLNPTQQNEAFKEFAQKSLKAKDALGVSSVGNNVSGVELAYQPQDLNIVTLLGGNVSESFMLAQFPSINEGVRANVRTLGNFGMTPKTDADAPLFPIFDSQNRRLWVNGNPQFTTTEGSDTPYTGEIKWTPINPNILGIVMSNNLIAVAEELSKNFAKYNDEDGFITFGGRDKYKLPVNVMGALKIIVKKGSLTKTP